MRDNKKPCIKNECLRLMTNDIAKHKKLIICLELVSQKCFNNINDKKTIEEPKI